MEEKLINSFERQLSEKKISDMDFNIRFLVNKKDNFYNVKSYDCWGIISKLGPEKYNSWRKVAKQALENIKQLYPGKELCI